jgi:hypothetical protein
MLSVRSLPAKLFPFSRKFQGASRKSISLSELGDLAEQMIAGTEGAGSGGAGSGAEE